MHAYDNIIAIDPGVQGAAVLFDTGTGQPSDVIRYAERGSLREWLNLPHTLVVIEQVHASPIMSPSAAFAFGQSYGEWLGIIIASVHSAFAVRPQEWQKGLPDLPPSGPDRKRKLRDLAKAIYPEEKITLHDADAYLIGGYAHSRVQAGQPVGKAV